MKKIIFLIGCLIWLVNILFAQNDIFKGIDIDSLDSYSTFSNSIEGGIIAAGKSNTFNGFGDDLFIMKLDSDLNWQWFNHYKDTANSISDIFPLKILPTPDSGFFLCGSSIHPVYNAAVIKFNSSGAVQWYKRYLRPALYSYSKLITMISVNDSDYVLMGLAETACATAPKDHIFICKIDYNGNIIWNKFYVHPNLCYDELAKDIIKTNDSGFLITGQNLNYAYDAFAMKIDSAGNLQWYKIYQAGSYLSYKKIFQTSNNSYILIGHTNNGTSNSCITKIDASGNIIWNKRYDNSFAINAIAMAPDSSLLLTSFNSTLLTGVTLKTDNIGNVISSFNFPDSSLMNVYDLEFMSDSSIFFLGSISSPVTNTKDGFLLKTDSLPANCFVGSSVSVNAISFSSTTLNVTNYYIFSPVQDTTIPLYVIPETIGFTFYDLCNVTQLNEKQNPENDLSIFPNPTTDYITIHYNVTSNNKTTVMLYNLYGEIVYSENPEGLSEIKINMRSFAAGVYFVKVNVGGKEEVRKVVKY